MRLEDKSLERRDIVDNEQAELLEQAQIDEFGEQRFRTRAQVGAHTPEGYAEHAQVGAAARAELFGMMRDIFDGKEIAAHSQLDPMHQKAIDLLAAAVRGNHPRDRTFVFAEDRRMMLEQSLAALQPALAMGPLATMDHHAEGLTDEFARLIGDVNGLRVELAKLEATQEEYEPVAVVSKGKAGDEDDEDDTNDEEAEASDTSANDVVAAGKTDASTSRGPGTATQAAAAEPTRAASSKPVNS